ncbi:hypothetical protein LCGC14_1145580 [marine sediment metagenome]|uniref:Uncharacterized protein n=1 Tax=marine sediment metagenome TaxID=412755 RepID=A0A0F9M1T5_9ZZZZ
MLNTKRILKFYDILLKLLRFSIKNAKNPDYKEFDLVRNYLQLLKDLELNLQGVFNSPFTYTEIIYENALKIIFKDKLQHYLIYIDSSEKKELIQRFMLLPELADCAIDKEGEEELGIIYRNMKIMINSLSPFLKQINLVCY